MSRSGYCDDLSNWDLIRWRGQVASAIRGKRGQQFLRELLEALEAMSDKRLIRDELQEADGEVCALGALGVKRGLDLSDLDPEDHDGLAETFKIAPQLIQEIEFLNDEQNRRETPEERWLHMHQWVKEQLGS